MLLVLKVCISDDDPTYDLDDLTDLAVNPVCVIHSGKDVKAFQRFDLLAQL